MIRLKIGKKRFKGIYRWDEMTLAKFSELAALPMPEGYESFITAYGKFDEKDKASKDHYIKTVLSLTDKQINEEFPDYYRKVIACLSDAPLSLLKQVSSDLIEDNYLNYFQPFVLSLMYHKPVINFMGSIKDYEPEQMDSVRIGLERFYFPKVVRIMDQDIPLADEPILSYSEASDIFKDMKVSRNDVHRLALFMAIYCRKRGEEYSEASVLKRQELFMQAPMSVVWSVFFYTVRRLPGYTMTTLLFGGLPKAIHETVNQVRIYQSMEAGG